MDKSWSHDLPELLEAQFEPGSDDLVLKNVPGIKSRQEMDQAEALALLHAQEEVIRIFDRNHRFTAGDICRIHKIWLGEIYSWAGQYRNINISKGGFIFAAAPFVPDLMAKFEEGPLILHTPCISESKEEVIKALAEVHTELMLIRPFREGNGRIARLLAILMALQANLPPLDFSSVLGRKLQKYFDAVQAGVDRNYEPMERIFSAVISWSLRCFGKG